MRRGEKPTPTPYPHPHPHLPRERGQQPGICICTTTQYYRVDTHTHLPRERGQQPGHLVEDGRPEERRLPQRAGQRQRQRIDLCHTWRTGSAVHGTRRHGAGSALCVALAWTAVSARRFGARSTEAMVEAAAEEEAAEMEPRTAASASLAASSSSSCCTYL